jgi:hypothetical protein
MAANFPSTPTIGDTVTIENITYKWSGTTWNIISRGIVAPVVQSNNGTIDLSKGNYHKILIDSGNNSVTVSFTNVSPGSSKWFLELNVSDSYTITWPDSVIWEAATAPATSGSQTLILEFYTPDGGTNIYGVESINRDETPAYLFQGSVSGYTSGGYTFPAIRRNQIEKFSFTSDGNATDVGDLTVARLGLSGGQSSSTHGYTSGGVGPVELSYVNTIDKFPFATDANATDVGDLTQIRYGSAGQSSAESGYNSGGFSPPNVNTIDKFPFATDGNATDVGDITQARIGLAGQSSSENGYASGGLYGIPRLTIDKFPFATDANATDIADLSVTKNDAAGQSSSESGYTSGGQTRTPPAPAFTTNVIDKFPFAADANATDVGDLTVARQAVAGQSSTGNGYSSGGTLNDFPPTSYNIIDKFPFASDTNATDVGDLTASPSGNAGQQV